MSQIETDIRLEQEAAQKQAEAKAIAEQAKVTKKWNKWVAQEKPRIAQFRLRIDERFPCLKGDYEVNSRNTDYLSAPFIALVEVRGTNLEIREFSGKKADYKYTLFVPYEERGDWAGWITKFYQCELKSEADLKREIKEYIKQRDLERAEAQRYYDSLPIGNTD